MIDILEAAKLAIQYGIVWETVKNDLPLVVDSIENILGTD